MNATNSNPKLLDSLALLHGSPHLGMLTATLDRVTDANDAFLSMVGYTRQEMEAGLIDWRAMTPPEYATLDERALCEIRQFGFCVPFEKEYVLRDGTRMPILLGAVRLRCEPLEWACWVANLSTQKAAAKAEQEARELKMELEAELRGAIRIYGISARLLGKHSLHELFAEILDAAIEVTDAEFGNIQIRDGDVLRIVEQRGFGREFLEFFRDVSHDTTSACSAALERGSRVIIEDVESDGLFKGTDARCILLRAGIHALQSTPLLDSSGEVVGVLSTHFRVPHRPSERAFRYLDLLATRAAVLIERLQKVDLEREAAKLSTAVEMANALAHEINNPVQALTNILTLLSEQKGVNEQTREWVQLAQEQLSRVSENVQKILSVGFGSGSSDTPQAETIIEHLGQ